MRITESSLLALSCALAFPSMAAAQDSEMLPEAVAEGERVDDAYVIGTGNDSGTSTIAREEIEARTPGSGDVNQLLKILPTVQFNRNEGLADPDSILDLRPANISISGGRVYDNLITLDGVDVGSRLDVTNNDGFDSGGFNPYNSTEPAGNAAQNIWLDANLIGEIALRDSNVSAEFGSFTGGALNIETRRPSRYWAASGYANYTSDETTKFNVSEGTRAAFADADTPLPESPNFHKWRFGGTLDVPVSDNVALLFGASRQVAQVTNYRNSRYGGGSYEETSENTSLLASALVDFDSGMNLLAKGTYTPYRVETSRDNAYGLDVLTKGGGYTGELQLSNDGPVSWEVRASYVHADTGRESDFISYSIPSDLCTNSSCSIGGNGVVNQTQDTYVASFKLGGDVGPGTLRAGFEYEHVDAHRDQPEDDTAFSRPFTEEDAIEEYGITGNIICDAADPLTCVEGEYATNWVYSYPEYSVDVRLDSFAAWTEYDASIGAFDMRAGVRYDFESFLGNHDFAPRFALTWNVPGEGNWRLTAGANRYYGKSMLAYAIREALPNSIIYEHNPVVVGDDLLFSDDDLSIRSETIRSNYNSAQLDTPYNDELAGAVTGSLFGGTVRLKGILRWGRDEFARSAREWVSGDTTLGPRSYNYYEITNDGSTDYKGISLEWARTLSANHTVALSANYSKTERTNSNYIEVTNDVEWEDTLVAYNGDLITGAELLALNQDALFASPLILNATWTAQWYEGRMRTNVNLRYRNGFTRIEDTLTSETIDGERYDLFADVRYRDNFDLNLNAELDLIRTSYGTVTADMRASNLLNRIASKEHVSTTYPWQYGRQFWFGLKFTY